MRAPPLWALPAAAAIVAAIMAGMLPGYLQVEQDPRRIWPPVVETMLEPEDDPYQPVSPGSSRLGVIAIGTSHLNHATEASWNMDALALELGKRPLRWTRICAPGREWDALPLIESVCATRPQVLLIENEILFTRSWDLENHESGFETFLDYLRYRVLLVAVPPKSSGMGRWPIRIMPGASEESDIVKVTPRMIAARQRARASSFHPEEVTRVLDVLRKAHAEGVTIAILDLALPSCPVPWAPEELAKIAEAHSVLEREVGAVILKCPVEFSAADYYDHSHLKTAARKRLSRWLVGELDRLPVR
ncbi:MAG: hypothetical protein K8T20_01180 [Planctomycetes bacterium]|nr:hypothetical protein [Planctomycetota bacterium]